MITRKINWIESIKKENHSKLDLLEKQLGSFYTTDSNYYSNIDFTADNWINETEIGYKEIARAATETPGDICEVGCGSSNILKHHGQLEPRYYGCDFSSSLLERNKALYPDATFVAIAKPNSLPFLDSSFDFVFSVFVLEHSTNPAAFLDECSRILKPGGRLIILCPNFLGKGRMTSQRAGWSEGTAAQKLKKGKIFDAVITLFDNRIRIPSYCRAFEKRSECHRDFL